MDNNNSQMITLKEASRLFNKSQTTLRGYIRRGLIQTDRREDKGITKIYINRRELTEVLSKYGKPDSKQILSPDSSIDRQVDSIINDGIRIRDEMIKDLKEEVKDLKADNARLRGRIDALQEEIKGLLRVGKRTIAGYLTDKSLEAIDKGIDTIKRWRSK